MYYFKILPHFKKQLKSLLKKYKNLKEDLIKELKQFNKIKCVALGQNIYKIRLKLSDINKGKSGGFRLIIFIIETNKIIYPLAIYFKGDKENINNQEIKYHLSCILDNINNFYE